MRHSFSHFAKNPGLKVTMWHDKHSKVFLLVREADSVSEEDLAEGLRQMGYQLRPHEMRMLAEQVELQNRSGSISKSAFLASQIDWHQEDLRQAKE